MILARTRLKGALLAGALAATLGAAGLPGAAQAAAPPFGASTVSITAREQPIGAFLQDLFSQAGLTVVLSPDLKGTVNGAFNGPSGRVYSGVAKAFNLLTYYDGVAVYVYPATEISSQAVDADMAEAPRIQAAVRTLGLPDAQNQVRVSNHTIVATGSKRFLDQVNELARGTPGASTRNAGPGTTYSAPPAPPPLQYRVYYLRYAWADDVTMTFSGRQVTLPGVASILRSLMTQGANGAAPIAQRVDSASVGGQLTGLKGQGLSPNAARDPGTLGFLGAFPPPAGNAAAWNAIGGQGGAGGDLLGAAAAPAADAVRVVADNRLNAVIIRDTAERLAAYDQLIRALDVQPQLVQLDATIIDIDTDKIGELGAGFSLSDFTGQQQFNLGVGEGGIFNPSPNGSLGNGGGGVLGAQISGGALRFRLGIQALIQKGYAKVVARPEIVTLSDVEAVFDNSRTFYVRVPGYAASDLYNINAGTTLRVTPHVTRDGGQTLIRLLIAIQDGNVTGNTVDRIPIVQNSGLNTQSLLVEGQSLLLGGLVTQADSRVVDKVPLFGDIPVLGFFFRSTRKESAHTERLFLITPHLISTGAANPLPANSFAPPALAPQSAPPPGYAPPAPPPPPATTPPAATTRPTH